LSEKKRERGRKVRDIHDRKSQTGIAAVKPLDTALGDEAGSNYGPDGEVGQGYENLEFNVKKRADELLREVTDDLRLAEVSKSDGKSET